MGKANKLSSIAEGSLAVAVLALMPLALVAYMHNLWQTVWVLPRLFMLAACVLGAALTATYDNAERQSGIKNWLHRATFHFFLLGSMAAFLYSYVYLTKGDYFTGPLIFSGFPIFLGLAFLASPKYRGLSWSLTIAGLFTFGAACITSVWFVASTFVILILSGALILAGIATGIWQQARKQPITEI